MLIEVFIPTYNHEKYIAKAIQSVLNQKTTYSYSIIVSNDCSTDFTSDEVIKIVNQHYDKIIYINNSQNKGIMNNYYHYLNSTNADIILFCEGDDYWIDENKLQKQVDYLIANEYCAVVFSAINNMKHDTEELFGVRADVGNKKKYYLKDILPHNTLNTLSAVAIKNVKKNSFPKWYTQCNTPDGPIYFILLGSEYYIQYMDFIGTNYRATGGIWSRLNKIEQQKSTIMTYEVLLSNLGNNYTSLCKLAILKSYLTLAKEYRNVDFKQSLYYIKKVILYNYWGKEKYIYILALPLILIKFFN